MGRYMNTWQSINTAPINGTEIDLWRLGKYPARITDAKWQNGRWEHFSLDNSAGYGELDWVAVESPEEVTHWMPKPGAPK